MNRYLIKMYYIDKNINKYEYQTQETIYFGEDKTIGQKIDEYIERLKTNFNFKVESYSIYKLIESKMIKGGQ